jgi:hypothetical protein
MRIVLFLGSAFLSLFTFLPSPYAEPVRWNREIVFERGARLNTDGHATIAFLHPARLFCMTSKGVDNIPVHFLKVDGCFSTVNPSLVKGRREMPRTCGELLYVRNLKKNGGGFYDLGQYAYLLDDEGQNLFFSEKEPTKIKAGGLGAQNIQGKELNCEDIDNRPEESFTSLFETKGHTTILLDNPEVGLALLQGGHSPIPRHHFNVDGCLRLFKPTVDDPSVLVDSAFNQKTPETLFHGCGNLEFSRDTIADGVKYDLIQTVDKVDSSGKKQVYTVANETPLPTGGVMNVPIRAEDAQISVKDLLPAKSLAPQRIKTFFQ